MSTPTPAAAPSATKNQQHTPQSTAAANAAGTTHTPRSVPSPAVNRAHASSIGASGAAAARTPSTGIAAGANGTPIKGGVAMVPSLSQASFGSTSSAGKFGAPTGLGIGGVKSEGLSPAHHLMGPQGGAGAVGGGGGGVIGFASPNAMASLDGLGIGTPGGSGGVMGLVGGVGVDGGVGMSVSLSDIGIHGAGTGMDRGKRDEDEERRKKLRGVLDVLGAGGAGRPRTAAAAEERGLSMLGGSGMGRISDEGVRRVGRWAGFDVEVEKKYAAKEWEGDRPIIIAGRNAVIIDLAFRNNLVDKVEVNFTSDKEEVVRHQGDAAKVLRQDLTPTPGQLLINSRLDRFAANLEALARLDKLSSPSVNCVDAVSGLYASLKRLYEHEKEAARLLQEASDGSAKVQAEDAVAYKGSGRPGMHVHRRIGLTLEYWKNKATDNTRVVEEGATADATAIGDGENSYSLELTVEHNDPNTYPSIRASTAWISDAITKQASDPTDTAVMEETAAIDWLDPPQTIAPLDNSEKEAADAMAIDSETAAATVKLPEVRFVARLHPPIVLPYAAAAQLLSTVSAPAMPAMEEGGGRSFESLLLKPQNKHEQHKPEQQSSNTPAATARRAVFVPGPDRDVLVAHDYALYGASHPDLGFVLRDFPFAHPRDVVAVLPALRQWAAFGALLRAAFTTDGAGSPAVPVAVAAAPTDGIGAPAGSKVARDVPRPMATGDGRRKKVALAALLGDEEDNGQNGRQDENGVDGLSPQHDQPAIAVDLTLSASSSSSVPALTLFFPIPCTEAEGTAGGNRQLRSSRLASVVLSFLPGGRVVVPFQDIVAAGSDDGGVSRPEKPVGEEECGGKAVAAAADDMELDSKPADAAAATSPSASDERIRADLARALDVLGGDLGVFVEWVRSRYGS